MTFESLILAHFCWKINISILYLGNEEAGDMQSSGGQEDTQDTVSRSADQYQQGVLLCSWFVLLLW